MPSESSQKSLEMRIADLEDKLAKVQASQSAAGQYVPLCGVYIPLCTQQFPYVPLCACAQQVPCQAAIPPCATFIPLCVAYDPARTPGQPAQSSTDIPPCSGAGKKDKGVAANDPSCEDFGGLGS